MKDYKKYSLTTILAIISFFLFYLFMTSIAGLLFAYSVILFLEVLTIYDVGIVLTILSFVFVTFSFSLFFFFIKFLFVKKIEERNHTILLDKEKEPKLYKQIIDICNKVDTNLPHKILLSPDVNASVSMPTNFWSLFSKPKKSLVIGLGLINVVNISEFKAVLAHEFGHFSQKSIGINPYLAHVNQIIFDMVFKKDKFDDFLVKTANIGFLSIFGTILISLVGAIRYLFEKVYHFINLSFMKLSRVNEYGADFIAAKTEGKENIIQGLRKIEFAQVAYENSTQILDEYLPQKIITQNVYEIHTSCMKMMAEVNEVPFEENMPFIERQKLNEVYNFSRIEMKDEWASHPTLIEREKNLEKAPANTSLTNKNSAWSLFVDQLATQKEITQVVYKSVVYFNYEEAIINETLFLEKLKDLKGYHPRFKGFYDNRKFSQIDFDKLAIAFAEGIPDTPSFYSDRNTSKLRRFLQNENDCQVLEGINSGGIIAKQFYFDGKKSAKKDAWGYIQKIKEEIETDKKWMNNLDFEVARYNYHYLKTNKNDEVAKDFLLQLKALNANQQFADRGQMTLFEVHNLIAFMSSKHFFNEDEVKHVNKQASTFFGGFRDWIEEAKDIPLSESVAEELEIKGSLYSYILDEDLIILKHTMFEDGTYGDHYMQLNNIIGKCQKVLNQQTKELLSYFQS